MGYSVFLKKGEDARIRAGHSWVYANEVSRIEGKDKNGSLASVFSFDGRFIGKGYINHMSKILVRVFIRDENQTDDKRFYLNRIKQSYDNRAPLNLSGSFRLIFAEADNLPALIVDKYEDVFVMQCLSLGVDQRKETIVECLNELFAPKGIYERSDVSVRTKEGLEEIKGLLCGEVPDKVIITENGIKMAVDVKNGQKTGYFLDQKENRFAARRYCAGQDVLDCFCNSGGFSLNAAAAGATQVTAADISQSALDCVRENAGLNGFASINTVCADVFSLLREYKAQNKKFGTVILDPPAFCKSANELNSACRGYKDINILGMKLVRSGGFLITSSCTHFMTFPLFEKMLTEAAKESGKNVRVMEIKSQSPDHPALLTAEETQYLKFFVLQIL